jgi:hypothetical protein
MTIIELANGRQVSIEDDDPALVRKHLREAEDVGEVWVSWGDVTVRIDQIAAILPAQFAHMVPVQAFAGQPISDAISRAFGVPTAGG